MVGRVRWGVILVAIGVLLLLNTTGAISINFWSYIWRLWPVILIAIGLEKIFSSTASLRPLAWLSPIVIILTLAYAVIAGERGGGSVWWHDDWSHYSSDDESDVYTWSETLAPGINRLELALQMTAGRLIMRDGAQAGNAVEGRITYRDEKPRVRSQTSGGTLDVNVADRSRKSRRGRDQWIIKLSDSLPVALTVAGAAARMRLDFADVPLETMTLSTAAGDIDVTFGSMVHAVECRFASAAASVDVTVPAGAGVRVKRSSVLQGFSSGDLDLIESGEARETPGFASKPVQITLYVESVVSSLRLHTATGGSPASAT
ncbi:MAG: DUF5668 domain-containing protein [Candidatus Zixiibacteriota bacterium]